MKYYSEKLNEMFDTPEALEQAEGVKLKKKKSSNELRKPEEDQCSKKQLAAEVDAADNALKEAYANYESARARANDISKKYLEEVNSILEPAKKAVKDAEKNRYEAIRKFNDSYGAYQVTYTGARAAEEMMKAINNINSRADRIFRDMFWF